MKSEKVNYFRLDLSYGQFQGMGKNLSYTNIGKYYIYEKIGEGGFGQVYKGMDDETKLGVAVKIIDLNLIKKEPNQRLKQIKLKLSKNEDKMMERCNSLNLIKCYDVYENDDLKIIVMQFCNGGTLEKHIEDRGKIPQKQAILILKQILNGIKELHSHKIIHRDLKAENILLDNTLFKIADFGFSKALDITNENMIGAHTLLGTITTMAPEVMARQKYGLKADIWSIGVIFFQMLFGKLPFNGNNKQEMYGMIIESDLMKKDSLKINGTSISKSAYDFLKLILVVDQRKRIGWRQLVNHPIFIDQHTNKISRVFIENQQVKLPENVDDEFNPQDLDMSNVTRKQTQTARIVKIVSQKIKGKQKQMQLSEQDRAFLWMNEKLYECLKAELIYQEVICKIKDNKLLDLEEREVIQLLYLLSTRCFLDLSPINAQMKNMYKLYPSFTQIYQTVTKLYERLRDSWNYYTKAITEQENGILNRFKDFIQKKEVIENRNKFMNGIENIDYTRKEQLNFIQKQFIRNLRNKITNIQFKLVKEYLLFYSEICLAQPSQLKKQGFDTFIERLVSH